MSNFVFFFIDPNESFVWVESRNERRFCWRTEVRRLPVACAGGDVKTLAEEIIDSTKRDGDDDDDDDDDCSGGGSDGVWNDCWDTDELSMVSSLTCNGYWWGCSILKMKTIECYFFI